jgi:hypothetical protein
MVCMSYNARFLRTKDMKYMYYMYVHVHVFTFAMLMFNYVHVCMHVLSNVMFTLGLAMIEGLGYISHFLKLYPSSILPFVVPRHHASSTAQLAFRIEDGHIPSCSVSHHSARPNATNNCPDIFSAISGVECLA